MMKFYKYQGAGNDFLVADNRSGAMPLSPEQITALCDRRYGIGADGLMLLEEDQAGGNDFRMVYFNSDGSGGMMCGNGGRCIVAFAADMGVVPSGPDGTYLFEAADGPHTAQVLEDSNGVKTVRLKMKDVSEIVRYDGLSGVGCMSDGWFLDTGTRHFVRQVTGLEDYDVVGEGRKIRYGAEELKPVGANVNFIESSDRVLKVRTYEKGVEDETFACGTGIVASCIAAYKSGIQPTEMTSESVVRYDVKAKRDALSVDFRPSGDICKDVYLTGPAAFVAEVVVYL